MRPIIDQSRPLLASVPHWLDDDTWNRSEFRYGVDDATRPLLDKPIGAQLTAADALVHLTKTIAQPLTYLELGLNSGKQFFQLMNQWNNANLFKFELEQINPVISRSLRQIAREQWPPSPDSSPRAQCSLTHYQHDATQNTIHHLSGDLFDPTCWPRLRGNRFNVISFATGNWPDELVRQWSLIQEHDLLDTRKFVLIWTNLRYNILGFENICRNLRDRFSAIKFTRSILKLRGECGINQQWNDVAIIQGEQA